MVIMGSGQKIAVGNRPNNFHSFPDNWQLRSLGEITTSSQYGISSSLGGNYSVPILKMNNLQNGSIDLGDLGYIQLSKAEMESLRLNKGDLLINRTNSLDLVGKTAIYDLEGEYVFASYLVRFRLGPSVLPAFVNYFLNSEPGQSKLKLLATKAVSQANINPSTLKKRLFVPIPPILEQHRIVEILCALDLSINLTTQLITKKRNIKQATMQQLLTGKMRLPGFSGGGSAKLGDFFELNPKKTYLNDTDLVTFIRMEDISESGCIINQNIMPLSSIKKGLTFFERNDVLVAKITPCFENGKGACLDTMETKSGFGSTEFHVLRAKKNAIPRYIFYQTQTVEFRQRLEAEMIGTAGQKRVPARGIIDYSLTVLHSIDEQTAIATILSDMDAEITALEQKRDKTRALKQGMMQELLTGKTRLL